MKGHEEMMDQKDQNSTSAPEGATAAPDEVQKVPVSLLSVPGGIPDLDADLRAAISAANGGPVRVRVPMNLFVEGVDTAYGPWRKVSWILEFNTPEMARELREDLDAFIRGWVLARQAGKVVSVDVVDRVPA